MGKPLSNGDLGTDSIASKINYRSVLKQIDEQLMKRDIKTLLFLTSDIIPASRREDVKRGIEFFEELELKEHLNPGNLLFLAELLHRIQRIDLLKKLDITNAEIQSVLDRGGTQLSKFRLLLFDVIENLTVKDSAALKFVVQPRLPRLNREAGKDPLLMFTLMEKAEILSPERLDILENALMSIGRNDLVETVQIYKGKDDPERKDEENLTKVIKHKDGKPTVQNHRVSPSSPPVPAGDIDESATSVPVTVQQFRSSGQDFLAISGGPMVGLQSTGACDENISIHYGEASIQPQNENGPDIGEQPNVQDQQKDAEIAMLREELQRIQTSKRIAESSSRGEALSLRDGSIYKMDARPRGICIIINNEEFYQIEGDPTSKKMDNRRGTDVDHGNLSFVFNKLEFEVYDYSNIDSQNMITLMIETARRDHRRYDCFVCCILTHGEAQCVYGVDGKKVPIQELTKFFTANTCPSLANKPKLFFVQACQGRDRMHASPLEKDAPGDSREETIPNEADFLMSYATLPGYVSFRSSTHGSWYITKLVEMLDMHADREDLLSILTRVNEEVGRAIAKIAGGIYKQIPAPMYTLRKKVFFC